MFLDDVGPDDVGGHQIRSELDPREGQVQYVGECVDEARLANAGDTLEQYVTTREQAGHGEVHDLLVTDDPAPDFLGNAQEALAELIDGLLDGGGGGRHCWRMKYVWTAVRRLSGTGGGATARPRSNVAALLCE